MARWRKASRAACETDAAPALCTGRADAAAALGGSWDDSFEGPTGELYFLEGDAVLEVRFRSSSTDIEGAAKLARLAITRL